MARRWPPIIGFTGFDGGTKPAISLATRKSRLQGKDTVEAPCTGACCDEEGNCTPGMLQSVCEGTGGTFQGCDTDCDPNPCGGGGCPETITITFSGVTFSCGCLPHDGISSSFEDTCPDHGGSFTFNDTPLELTLQVAPCEFGADGFDCKWASSGGNLCYVEAVYTTADCSGPVDNYFSADIIAVIVGRIGSTWYVAAVAPISPTGVMFFVGSGTDPSNITNDAFCTLPDPIDWDSPIIECFYNLPFNAWGVTTGGTASIAL